jgi:hypothetical protein
LFLLVFLVWRLGLDSLLANLALLGWMWIPLIALEGMGEALHAVAWKRCLSEAHGGLPWVKVAMIRQAGMAFNYMTPTAHLGGEVIKGAILGREGGGVDAAASVIVGKLALVLAQMLLVSVGSLGALWAVSLPGSVLTAWAASTLLFSTGIVLFLLLQRRGKLGSAVRALGRLGPARGALAVLGRWITEVDHQLAEFHRKRPGDLLRAMGWHILGFSTGIVQACVFLAWLDVPGPWRTGVAVWFLGAWFDLVGFIVPAGIGVQEGSRVLIFHAVGLTGIAGLTFGLVLRGLKAFWAMVGLGCYGLLLRDPGISSRRAL